MRSLVVLFALVAVAVAAPSHLVAYSVPSAVSHQSRVDVHSSPAVVATAPVHVVEPVVARTVVAEPVAVYTGASAVSHQSRVDVHSSPAVVATAPVVAAPVVAEHVVAGPAVVDARSVYAAPVATAYYGGASVSHQSRVDVHSSPAVVSEHVVAPAVYSVW